MNLSRNLFFYEKIELPDTFEMRIYLMFFHFSLILKSCKIKSYKFDQSQYDDLFHNIENNLRELGFGDVSVNKKMKELNKILYDILLKIKVNKESDYDSNSNLKLFLRYFSTFKDKKEKKLKILNAYFSSFFDYCFEIPTENMLERIKYFKI